MFNLFSKKQEQEQDHEYYTPSDEEMDIIMERHRERRKKEIDLYKRIVSNDEKLARVLQMMVHRIDLETDPSFRSEIGTLQSRIEERFPESND